MVMRLDHYSSRTTEGDSRNTMRARASAIMPFGPARGRRIYSIRSAADLMASMQEPYVFWLSPVQLAAIEQALPLADWSEARDQLDQRRRDREISIDRCRVIAGSMLSRGARR
jgi:hypothetical protein